MKLDDVRKFNSLINHLFFNQGITIVEFNKIASACGYNDKESNQILQHILKSNLFVQFSGKIFVKSFH